MITDDRRQRDRLADYPGRALLQLFLGGAFLLTGASAWFVDRSPWAALPAILGVVYLAKGIDRWRRDRG